MSSVSVARNCCSSWRLAQDNNRAVHSWSTLNPARHEFYLSKTLRSSSSRLRKSHLSKQRLRSNGNGSEGREKGKTSENERDQHLVSFSETDHKSQGLTSLFHKQPVSVNIGTLSSYEQEELAVDGGISSGRFVLEADEVQELKNSTGLSEDELLLHLVSPAATLARPPVSLFHVGAVGLGASGRAFVGINLEFRRLPLSCSVHAEQFLVVNLLHHGEEALRTIAVSAAPCGYCRQFYSELACAAGVRFIFGSGSYTLDELLPQRFRPQDLLGEPPPPLLLEPQDNPVRLAPGSEAAAAELLNSGGPLALAARQALEQARRSYAPYSGCPAGLGIVAEDGRVYSGAYIESAAYNPSLPPLQSALVSALVQGMPSYQRVTEVILAERSGVEVRHAAATELMLSQIAPHAPLRVL
eukprot:CAMPEP_0177616572 /NCGR_PEP_ID=MMETSP0419_2-20121207/24251_1 /TAXON_ID=582737 /ORGANISM="Tetraselmis sp., Strain GSL018" /LENGTH=412 /DNA_ID=CAMNT_0019114687 /DNA_START=89 /DNA_END=1324 /DNA_ORIENTATION=+